MDYKAKCALGKRGIGYKIGLKSFKLKSKKLWLKKIWGGVMIQIQEITINL